MYINRVSWHSICIVECVGHYRPKRLGQNFCAIPPMIPIDFESEEETRTFSLSFRMLGSIHYHPPLIPHNCSVTSSATTTSCTSDFYSIVVKLLCSPLCFAYTFNYCFYY